MQYAIYDKESGYVDAIVSTPEEFEDQIYLESGQGFIRVEDIQNPSLVMERLMVEDGIIVLMPHGEEKK